MLDLSIIIVNYNGEQTLQECLDCVFSHQTRFTYEVIVVDNASRDSSIDELKRYGSRITLIQNKENRGFSAGNNQGLAKAKGEYIFLLNNDAILQDNTIDQLILFLKEHPTVGAVGPRLLNPNGSIQQTGSILGQWMYRADQPRKVSFLSGAALMAKKSLLDELDGLDEAFFFYNEDIDLCKRILKKGLKLAYLPNAPVIHYGGVSTKTRKAASIVEGFQGGLYLCKKHYPKLVYWLYKLILFIYLLIAIPVLGVLSFFQARHKELYSAYRSILSHLFFG